MASVYQRVVSLQPSVTVVMERLGRKHLLVGVTRWCKDVADVAGLPAVGDCWTATAREIEPLRADLVIGSVPYREQTLTEILKLGLPFLGFAPKRLADVYRDIRTLGALFGAQAEAEQCVGEMQLEIDTVRERVAGAPRVRTYCEEWGKPLIVSQHWVRELVEAAGGEFLFDPGTKPGIEEVAERDPEAIIIGWCGAGNRVPLRKTLERRSWLTLTAVRQGRAAVVSDECLNTPAPTLIEGLHAIAAVLHPSRCADLLPAGKVIFAGPVSA